MSLPEISLVVPMLNEGANVERLIARLIPVIAAITPDYEILFIDDGSTDSTLQRIRNASKMDRHIRAVSFSRNFGKEVAIAAGLDHALGRAVILIDADLQHPPELIKVFVEKWREGYDMVYGRRQDRLTESVVRRTMAHTFYNLFERFGEVELPDGAGDFRLLDAKVVNAIRQMPERARFSKGLYAWVGFKSIGVPFDVAHRVEGGSKWKFRKLFRFAFDGITSFSNAPLKVWTFIGLSVSALAFFYALFFVFKTLVYGIDVPGYPSLIISVMFFAGIQLMSLGILGEYIGRIFAEVKRRPLYVVAERIEPETIETAEPPPAIGKPPQRRRARLLA
jgi:polyisoprenyl-phosphate glycosyltransferase